jgi:glycosyltransferase involved in cell wall biosynthesis
VTPAISVVIPVRAGGCPGTTLRSLAKQTFRDFEIILSPDIANRGACWARNRGAEQAKGDLILFSDDDIDWMPAALELLLNALRKHPEASYSYGSYKCAGRTIGDQRFDPVLLRYRNYISTMSLVRRADHPGWDESLQRLQDWDVWLTMLERGLIGVHCGMTLFTTDKRAGITYGGIGYEDAYQVVRAKHRQS